MVEIDKKEEQLLELVIEHYVKYGTPIGSKFLDKKDYIQMAPSTIRKYLNFLEKKWLVYQPYNSAWRIPTVEGVGVYIQHILAKPEAQDEKYLLNLKQKFNLRHFIEILWEEIDGVAFGYYENEKDMHYLGLAKVLKKVNNDLEKIIPLIDFIEKKQLITYLSNKEVEPKKINYSFVNYQWTNIVMMYIKTNFEGNNAIIWAVSSLRVDYKSNIKILQTILDKWQN